jgi:pantothenate kinase-related protein Tda10
MQIIYENKKYDLDRKINNIRAAQARLPKKLFDYNQFENLIDELLELEGKEINNVYAKVYHDNLVVVYSGQYVKFGKLVPNKKKNSKSSKDVMDLVFEKENNQYFRDMAAYLSDDTEVIKVIETIKKNWL